MGVTSYCSGHALFLWVSWQTDWQRRRREARVGTGEGVVARLVIWLPLLRLTNDGGVPWDDLHKFFIERSGMAKLPNGVETLPKISIA